MIFIGDIASPTKETTFYLDKALLNFDYIFNNQVIVCNFEGLISEEFCVKNKPILWNHPSVPEILIRGKEPVFCLANNHTLDLPNQFISTIKILKQKNIKYCGAGLSFEEADKPVIIYDGPYKVAVFNRCWDFLCYNHKNPSHGIYVATIKEKEMIETINHYKNNEPELFIAVFFHWNLDLEILPFPMYRQFAKALIDNGANIVVGSHSHCVQGGEKYNNGYIIYGLGNFYLPGRYFSNGKIFYPDFASTELAFEWNPDSNKAKCHWFEYELENNNKHILKHFATESFEQSQMLTFFTPYSGLNEGQYIDFFLEKRRKKFLIPVFKDYRNIKTNKFYTNLLKRRAKLARILAKLNVIKWQK